MYRYVYRTITVLTLYQ